MEETGTEVIETSEIITAKAFSPAIVKAFNAIDEKLKYMTEIELRNKFSYTTTDERIKQRLWTLIANHLKDGKPIVSKRIYAGVCSDNYFYNRLLVMPHKLAFLTHPVEEYEVKASALLNMAVSRYEEILSMDIKSMKKFPTTKGEDGKMQYEYREEIDVAKAKLLLETIANIENRVKGTSVSKVVSVHETAPKGAKVEEFDIKKINERILELEHGLSATNIDDGSISIEADYVEVENGGA